MPAKFKLHVQKEEIFLEQANSWCPCHSDPLEKFFGMQCQRGRTNENPTIQQVLTNTQALCVINTTCKHVTVKGNTRGKKAGEEQDDEPLKKRKRK